MDIRTLLADLPKRPAPKTCDAPASYGPCRNQRKVLDYHSGRWDQRNGLPFTDRHWQLGGCRLHLTEVEQGLSDMVDVLNRERYQYNSEVADLAIELRKLTIFYDSQGERLAEMRRDLTQRRLAVEPACWEWRREEPTLETFDYAGLLAWHRGRCAICGKEAVLATDHDHWSEFVRGFLCNFCNRGEGPSPLDDIDLQWSWTRVGGYRQYPPARLFGLLIPYKDVRKVRRLMRQAPVFTRLERDRALTD